MSKETDFMSEALVKPVSMFFDTEEDARSFRASCYRQKSALRLLDVRAYESVKFKLNRNVLTAFVRRPPQGKV